MKKQLIENFSFEADKQYKQYRNKLKKIIKDEKNNYYKQKILDSNKNYKQIWGVINEITNKSSHNNMQNINLRDAQGNIITEDKEKADCFNEFFVNIGQEMAQKITPTKSQNLSKNIPRESLFLKPVTDQELILNISTLRNNSSPGPDGITVQLIKTVHLYIIKPLRHIINLTFNTFKIPKDWKVSVVTPVYKSGDRANLTNYRPISLINNLGKIFEKCLKQRLTEFLDRHNILYEKQFGFRSNKNTEDAVFEFTNLIMNNLNKSKKSLAVFLDLAKAFDTVNHKTLLTRLEEAGVRGNSLKLLTNYLSNRIQKVKIAESLSEPRVISMGIPQGTVLGPVLFLVYINQIGNMLADACIVSYADDTAILFTGANWSDVYKKAEIGLSKVQTWLNSSLLSLNVKKTNYITFSTSAADQPDIDTLKIHQNNCLTDEPINCSCTEITRIKALKYLGVIVDQHLRWSDHCDYVTEKIRKLFYKFYQIRDILSKKLIKILYNALVESILRYCIVVWGGAYNNAQLNLSICQNTALKIIFKKERRYSTTLLYKHTETLNIKSLYVHCCLNYLLKIKHLFPTVFHNYGTRSTSNEMLTIPFFTKTHNQRHITYFAPKFFNALPPKIKLIVNKPHKFKTETKNYIMKNYDDFYKILDERVI